MQIVQTYPWTYVKKYFIYTHNNSVQVHITHHACTAFQLLIKTVGVLSLENRITCPHLWLGHQPQKCCGCWMAQHSAISSPHSCLLQRPSGFWQWCKYRLFWCVHYLLSLNWLRRVSLHMKQQLDAEWEGLLFGSTHPFVAGSAVGLQFAWHHSTLLSMLVSLNLLLIALDTL